MIRKTDPKAKDVILLSTDGETVYQDINYDYEPPVGRGRKDRKTVARLNALMTLSAAAGTLLAQLAKDGSMNFDVMMEETIKAFYGSIEDRLGRRGIMLGPDGTYLMPISGGTVPDRYEDLLQGDDSGCAS